MQSDLFGVFVAFFMFLLVFFTSDFASRCVIFTSENNANIFSRKVTAKRWEYILTDQPNWQQFCFSVDRKNCGWEYLRSLATLDVWLKVAVLKILFEINFIFLNSHLFVFPPLRLSTKIKTVTARESPTRTVKVIARHLERAVSLTDCVGESERG